MKEGISICITAYNADKYIEECLDSVKAQTWFKKHSNWEIIVGIDGCEKTLEKMMSIQNKYKKLKILMMEKNYGTYITTNTIMSEARYKNLLRFDSDDIMLPEMVETLMQFADDYDFLMFSFQNFGLNDKIFKFAHGVTLQKSWVFDKFGGYQPWRCSADDEYRERLKKFVNMAYIPKILFKRRIHEESLTQAPETSTKNLVKGGERDIRKRYIASMSIKKEKDAKIKCVTGEFHGVLKKECEIVKAEETKPVEKTEPKEENVEIVKKKLLTNLTSQLRDFRIAQINKRIEEERKRFKQLNGQEATTVNEKLCIEKKKKEIVNKVKELEQWRKFIWKIKKMTERREKKSYFVVF